MQSCPTHNKDALIADLPSKHPYNSIHRRIKTKDSRCRKRGMLRVVRNIYQQSMSLLLELLDGRNCSLWLRYVSGSCRCNTKIQHREVFDTLTSLTFLTMRSGRRGARRGKSDAQREHRQARLCLRKAHKNGFKTILQRFSTV